MFKGVYKIERWKGRKTEFHKRYYVFDGLGSFYFDTLIEARSYVSIKSELLKNLYNSSKSIYKKLSECYFDKLIKFRIHDSDNQIINDYLRDILDSYKFLSKQFFPEYILGKLKHIYNTFLNIANVLKLPVLHKTIKALKDSFFIPYPVYRSADFKHKNIVQLINNQNVNKKCHASSS